MLTETSICTRVLERLGATEADLPFPRIISQVSVAIDRLGEKLASGQMPEIAESLRREFTVTATNGEADLSTLFSQGFVPSAFRLAKVFQGADTQSSEYQPDRQAVSLMARSGFPVHAREGSTLILGDSSGGVGTLNATVKVRGVALPVANDGSITWTPPAESALLDELTNLLMPPAKAA